MYVYNCILIARTSRGLVYVCMYVYNCILLAMVIKSY